MKTSRNTSPETQVFTRIIRFRRFFTACISIAFPCLASLVAAQALQPFDNAEFDTQIAYVERSVPEVNRTLPVWEAGAWHRGREHEGSGVSYWESNDLLPSPTGTPSDNAARCFNTGAQAIMQIASIHGIYDDPEADYVQTKKLQFYLLYNDSGNRANAIGLRVEVFGIKHHSSTGYFALSPSVPGAGQGDINQVNRPDFSGGDTVSNADYDVLLNTKNFTLTTDATITANTWQPISLNIDFGAEDPFSPQPANYDRVGIRITAYNTASPDVAIAVDKVSISDGIGPIALSLDGNTLEENAVVDTLVGNLSATDRDAGETFTYSLVSGDGDTDNGLFRVSGSQLLSNHVFDYESQTTASVRLQVENSAGLTYEQSFLISIQDLPDQAPTDVSLSSTEIAEGDAIGTLVGEVIVMDPDAEAGDSSLSYSYRLVTGEGDKDNSLFSLVISGGKVYLSTSVVFDFEIQNEASIRMRVRDPHGNSLEKQFTISVLLDGSVNAQAQFDGATSGSGLTGADAAPDASPFSDDVENILKYAFNMNLGAPDASTMTEGGDSGLPVTRIREENGQTYLRVEYVVRKGSGLAYTPQKSSTLGDGSFVPLGGARQVVNIDSEWQRVIIDEPCDPATQERCFSRVLVTLP